MLIFYYKDFIKYYYINYYYNNYPYQIDNLEEIPLLTRS